MTKKRLETNMKMKMMTRIPKCEASMLGEEEGLYKVGKEGKLVLTGQGGREVGSDQYCLDQARARVCKEEERYW